jgi:hypothetical protein
MQPTDVYNVLKGKRAIHLHHANSVGTSCTFLEEGALLSRNYVEQKGLFQTAQSSDAIDKQYTIWDRIFLDHVDIHDRGGKGKGHNRYGPVLFKFDLDILLGLPPGTNIEVTKCNPIYWNKFPNSQDRWFQTVQELASTIRFGNFDKMLVIKTPDEKFDLSGISFEILLDDPQQQLSSGQDAYQHADGRIRKAISQAGLDVMTSKRQCQQGCICLNSYAKLLAGEIDQFFE